MLYGRRANDVEFPEEIGLNPSQVHKGIGLGVGGGYQRAFGAEWAFRGSSRSPLYGLLIVNDQGDIVMVNKVLAQSLGYAAAALVNQPLQMLLPERYRHGHGGLMAGYTKTGKPA